MGLASFLQIFLSQLSWIEFLRIYPKEQTSEGGREDSELSLKQAEMGYVLFVSLSL